MMDEEAAFDKLSSEENAAVWNETEQKFWDRFEDDQETWRANHNQKTMHASNDIRAQLSSLTARRSILVDTQARLARELAMVEDDLRAVSVQCDARAADLDAVDQDHRAQLAAQVANWERQSRTMASFFRRKRGEQPVSYLDAATNRHRHHSPDAPSRPRLPLPPPPTSSSRLHDRTTRATAATAAAAAAAAAAASGLLPTPSTPTHAHGTTLVDVVDADMNVIGPLQRVEPWNQWISAVLRLPIERPVKIRRGRRFNEDHLATVYDRTEAKGVKWLACMIQATGRVQSQRCQSCDKNQGAFEKCVIVGGDLLQKCGNCEWNRQGCHGASYETIDIPAAERKALEQRTRQEHRDRQVDEKTTDERDRGHHEALERERRDQDVLTRQALAARPLLDPAPPAAQWAAVRPGPAPISQITAAADHAAKGPPQGLAALADRATLVGNPMTPPTSAATPPPSMSHRRLPPLPIPPIRDPRDLAPSTGFTPANTRSRPESRESPLPLTAPASTDGSPQFRSAEHEDAQLPDINKDNLVLRHDGQNYTSPECMVGVPLAKIHPGHPYWEPEWKDVRAEVFEARERWRQKHQWTVEAEARNERIGSSKYQIGRQVNRGTKILEFLDDENQISPYQLLAKKFIYSPKGGITSYDTLFRLCETLSELSKFNIDVSPVDWMRHRLHELMTANKGYGDKFNLTKTVHDFYHDPKLTALRHKHGFKNIGRPSGQNKGSPGGPSSATPVPLASIDRAGGGGSVTGATKRKSGGATSPGGTPRQYTYVESPLGNQLGTMYSDGLGQQVAAMLPPYKKRRQETTGGSQLPSFGHLVDMVDSKQTAVEGRELTARVDRGEGFRLSGLQSRAHDSNIGEKQYWIWSAESGMLLHRILRDGGADDAWLSPTGPYEFNLRLADVDEVQYDTRWNRAYVYIPPQSDTGRLVNGRRRGDLLVEFATASDFDAFMNFAGKLSVPLKRLTPGLLDRWDEFRSASEPEKTPESGAVFR